MISPPWKCGARKWRRGEHRGAILLVTWREIRWSELEGDTGVERALGAGAVVLSSRSTVGAGERRVVIEAELVLPVAIGHPDIHEVAVFGAPDRLGGVHGQTDRLRVELDRRIEDAVAGIERQRFSVRTFLAI